MRVRSRALALVVGLGVVGAISPAARADVPLFTDATPRLGAPQPCFDPKDPGAEGCNSHYALVVDLDGDGLLDILFANGGGYFVPATDAPLAFYRNGGAGAFRENSDRAWPGHRGRHYQVAVGDIDGDGDLDVYAPDGFGLAPDALFVNEGGAFRDEGAQRIAASSRASAARFGDLDGDGDLDLVVSDWGEHPPASPGTARVYVNDGAGHFSERFGAVPADTAAIGLGPVDVDLLDVDGDFDLDLVIANRVGDSLLFRNDGAGRFVREPSFPAQPGPYVYGPDACDVDGDGDLDLWLDNRGNASAEQLLINDGAGHFTDETAARVSGDPPITDDNVVRCADVDGDGSFDAVIGAVGTPPRVLLNDGHGRFAAAAGAFPAVTASALGLDLGDLDGDGRLDAVTAAGETPPFLNRLYLGTAAVARDTRPPLVRAIERLRDGTPASAAIVRFAVSDGATSDVGPRLRSATLEIGDAIVPAKFVGGDLFRAVVPTTATASAVLTYRACAVDWAGNRGCSAPVVFVPGKSADVPYRYAAGGGCDVGPGAPRVPVAALLFAALIHLARRRNVTGGRRSFRRICRRLRRFDTW